VLLTRPWRTILREAFGHYPRGPKASTGNPLAGYTRQKYVVMKLACILASALLFGAFALPSFSKDWLFVTTNWNEGGNEQVRRIDPESGQTRILWNEGAELDAVVSPDAARLYVNYIRDLGKGEGLAVVDIATGAVLQKVDIPQAIRWISPSTPSMAISADGRWLYLLKTNYSVGSSEYFLMTFDTWESRFASNERSISQCPGPHLLPVAGAGQVLVLCGGETSPQPSDGDLVLRLQNFQNFAQGQGPTAQSLYVAGWDGRIQAVNLATHEVTQTAKDTSLLRHRRIMPSSGTLSPDGRLWYLPIKIPNNGEQWIEQILVLDTQTMSRADIITPAGPFWGLALSSDGQRLYASQPDLKSIMVIDTQPLRHRTIRLLAVGGKPSIVFVAKAP
jgi:hypothetical protein